MNPESLKWREWDMLSGGLEAFISDEEAWLDDDKNTLWASEMGLKR